MMTKKLKTTLLSILSALLLVTALFFVSPATAKAEETESGLFYFKYGAQISSFLYERKDETNNINPEIKEPRKFPLRFTLSPTDGNLKYSDLIKFAGSWSEITLETVEKETARQSFNFTLRRRQSGTDDKHLGEWIPLYQVVITYYFPDPNTFEVGYVVTTKKLSNCKETIYFPQMTGELEGAGTNYQKVKDNLPAGWIGDLHTVKRDVEQGLFNENGEAYIGLNVESPFEYYDVVCKYDFYEKKDQWLTNRILKKNGECASVSRSVQQILQFMEADEYGDYLGYETEIEPTAGLNNEINLWEICAEIVGNEKKRVIKLSYLEEIKGTPFAQKKQISVEANVLSSGVTLQDVYAATNNMDFSVFNSDIIAWELRDTDQNIYDARYLRDKYLISNTTENKELKYFFDINTSFEDAFYGYVEKGFLTAEEYEYAFSQIFNKYEALKTKLPSEVYGRFGLILSPDTTFTIQALLREIFGADDKTLGAKVLSQGKTTVNITQYNSLLNEYGYGFYTKLYETVYSTLLGTPLEVDYYIIYSVADGEIEKGSPSDKVGGWLRKAWGTVSNFVGNFLGITEDATKTRAGTIAVVLTIVIVVIVIVLFKTGAIGVLIGQKNKRRRK